MVTAVQMISLRVTTEDFGRAKLQQLMEEIETAEMVSGDDEISRGEEFGDYYTVALTYQDETTDAFYCSSTMKTGISRQWQAMCMVGQSLSRNILQFNRKMISRRE